ncbi:hypothetical protein Tco_1304356 [Tanacetum coccineum]
MEESLSKFMAKSTKIHDENSNLIKEIQAATDAAIQNQGASIKALEIQIEQMGKVIQERSSGNFIVLDMPEDIKVPLILERPFLSTAHAKIDVFKRKITLRVGNDKIRFKSVKPTSSLIKRVYVVGLRERMDLDLEARLMDKTLILHRSLDPDFGDFIELNDLNEPLELKRNQVEDLDPAIEGGEVIDKPMIDIIETRNDDGMVKGINEYPIVESMDPYHDQEMGDVIVGGPFCREIYVKARRFDGIITIYNGNDSGTYQMA